MTFVFLQVDIERESGIQNLGIKEKRPQSYLSYFSTGFHWRIFFLSRANRLCSIFFFHWLEEPGVPRVSVILLSSTRSKMAMVRLPRALLKNWLSYYLFPLTGGSPTSILGSQPIIWLLSPSPSGVRRPEVTKYQHLLISPLWPTFSLNGHFFWRLDTVNSNTRSSNFISLLPVGYHVTYLIIYGQLFGFK